MFTELARFDVAENISGNDGGIYAPSTILTIRSVPSSKLLMKRLSFLA